MADPPQSFEAAYQAMLQTDEVCKQYRNTHRLEAAQTNPVLIPRPTPEEYEFIEVTPGIAWNDTTTQM